MDKSSKPFFLKFAHHVAFWPVVAGIAILLAYFFTGADWLIGAGIYLFYGAIPINLIAVMVLLVMWFRQKKFLPELRASTKSVGFATLALILNYPFGVLCIFLGLQIYSTYYAPLID